MNAWLRPRTVIAFLIYLTFCYLTIMQTPLPQEFVAVVVALTTHFIVERSSKKKE